MQPELIETLLRHPWTLNIRELERVLWVAIASSHGDYVTLTPEVVSELGKGQPRDAKPPRITPKVELPDRDRVAAALQAAQGRVAQASSALGLTSRYVLYRLIRQYGLEQIASESA